MDKYKVTLFDEERQQLNEMVKKGKAAARKLTHARILLLADESEGRTGRTDEEIAGALQVTPRTISRVRKRFVMGSLEEAVNPQRQPPRPDKIKITEPVEEKLIELACGDPPQGRCAWTLQLLADKLVVLSEVEGISRETVRKALKKTTSRWAS
jgi:DNA-binding MarR family transcriptional regulator